MRPKVESFASPLDTINFAKSESNLDVIESLTFKISVSKFASYNIDKLLFVNSLSS